MRHEVPAAAVVVPPLIVGLAAVLWWLRRRAAVSPLRVLAGAVACIYAAGIIANTVLPIYVGGVISSDRPSWTVYLTLTPVAGHELRDFVENVIVFLRLGVLLPIVFRVDAVLQVLLCGFLLSLGMEAAQLINSVTGHGGHVADVNDLLANTLGAPIGYGIFRVALLVPGIRRLATAAAWPGPAELSPSG